MNFWTPTFLAELADDWRRALREGLIRLQDLHGPGAPRAPGAPAVPDLDEGLICRPDLIGCTLSNRVALALDWADTAWKQSIVEPPRGQTNAFIDDCIRGPKGLTWSSAEVGPGARPNQPYRRDKFAWCGAFAARVFGEVGLKRKIRRDHLASLWRIYNWAHGTPRFISRFSDVRPGDIVVEGPHRDVDGAHITIARKPPVVEMIPASGAAPQGSVEIVQGNGKGALPSGEVDEGVTHDVAKWSAAPAPNPRTYVFAYAVRLLEEDFD